MGGGEAARRRIGEIFPDRGQRATLGLADGGRFAARLIGSNAVVNPVSLVDARRSRLIEPLSQGEAALLTAIAPLAADTPRAVKRFLNAYRVARLVEGAAAGGRADARGQARAATARRIRRDVRGAFERARRSARSGRSARAGGGDAGRARRQRRRDLPSPTRAPPGTSRAATRCPTDRSWRRRRRQARPWSPQAAPATRPCSIRRPERRPG